MPQAPAAVLGDHTTGGEHASAPRGAFKRKDEDYIEELLTEAVQSVERLLGRVWDGTRHNAKRHRPYDQQEWEQMILTKYEGVRNRMVAAEESVAYYVIRDLRKRHGKDGYGRDQMPSAETD